MPADPKPVSLEYRYRSSAGGASEKDLGQANERRRTGAVGHSWLKTALTAGSF